MKFVAEEDSNEDQIYAKVVSENGLVEIGIHPVMFGFRVRAGFAGSQTYDIDYCGGADQLQVETLYSMTVAILSQREEDRRAFAGMPGFSKVKPYFKDTEFSDWITSSAKQNYTHVSLPPLQAIRDKMLNQLFKK